MSLFPVEPTFAKVLIKSQSLKCTKEAIAIVSMLSIDPIFFSTTDNREESSVQKKIFMSYDGDHITLLNVFNAYVELTGDRDQWCHDHFINSKSMRRVIVFIFN